MKGLTNEQKQRVEDLLQKMTLEEKIGRAHFQGRIRTDHVQCETGLP